MSIEVFLVRHGEAAAGWGESTDPGLSELGWQQANAVASQLQRHALEPFLLVSSPLRRARETAQPLAALLQQSVTVDATYREVPAPVPLSQRRQWLQQFMQAEWTDQEPSLMAWRQNIYARLCAIDTPTIIFTHFLVINAIVGLLKGSNQVVTFSPDNGSVTQLQLANKQLEIVSLGVEMQTWVN